MPLSNPRNDDLASLNLEYVPQPYGEKDKVCFCFVFGDCIFVSHQDDNLVHSSIRFLILSR